MKILHIIPELTKGGAERLVVDVCNELRTRTGIKVWIVVFRPKNAYAAFSNDLDIRVIPSTVVPSLNKQMKIEVTNLQHWIDTFQPDVIHSHLFETEMVLSQVNCGNAGRVVHFHDNIPQLARLNWRTFLSKKSITNFYERNLILRNWKKQIRLSALAISEDTYSYAKKVLPPLIPVNKLLNGIVVDRFKSNEPKSTSSLTLCMIGSLVPKKGQELAIRTVYALHEKGYPFHLHLLGDGPLREQLQQQTRELGLTEFIHFHGNVDHPELFLHQSSAYLHTAYYEPLGLVILEAMASRTPVVCTDGLGNRDLIQHGQNGFLITERDPVQLAEQVIELWENPQLTNDISEHAAQFVANFDIKNYVNGLVSIYSRL